MKPIMDEKQHKDYHRRLLYVFIVILLVLFGGSTFYYFVEGWRYLDAVYFSAYTITTVGYGDFVPRTDIGKIFTIIYVFMGVGIALYGISLLTAHFVEIREEFWLERLGRIKLKEHTMTFWEKVNNLFDRFMNFNADKLTGEASKSIRNEAPIKKSQSKRRN